MYSVCYSLTEFQFNCVIAYNYGMIIQLVQLVQLPSPALLPLPLPGLPSSLPPLPLPYIWHEVDAVNVSLTLKRHCFKIICARNSQDTHNTRTRHLHTHPRHSQYTHKKLQDTSKALARHF